jgi:hypothetical protein
VEARQSPSIESPLRTFFITVCYYGVDHTGNILFEQATTADSSQRRASAANVAGGASRRSSMQLGVRPFGAFASPRHHRRITLLPSGNTPLRVLQLTMDGDAGVKKSMVSNRLYYPAYT